MKRSGLLALFAILMLAMTLVWRQSASDHEQEQFQAGLWRLRHLDAVFNEDLLRVRFSLLESYDDFERYLHEMDGRTAALHGPPRFVGAENRGRMVRAAESLTTLLRERRRLFEQFKSRNAVLVNSRRYFPGAVNELSFRLGDAPADRELNRIILQVTGALLANSGSTDDLGAEAAPTVRSLPAWAAIHPSHPESGFVSSLSRHAQQLVVGKSELDGLTRQLLALPTAGAMEQLSVLYEQEVAAAIKRTQNYRVLLCLLGGVLVAVIAYGFQIQRGSNHRLEARVAERTRQLQAEIEERKRTALALKASEEFSNSLVQNLPVHVFRKDRSGRITFANQLFCDRVGRTREEVIGLTMAELIGGPEAEQQRRIDAGIMETGTPYESTDDHVRIRGEAVFLHVIKVPVFDAARQCVGVQGMFFDVTQRKRAEAELAQLHRQLLETSRQAGMAEVATGVLHNVGNVLNSVNVSATLVIDQMRESKAGNLTKLGRCCGNRTAI
jgi:PAS domain S-box-containing protein